MKHLFKSGISYLTAVVLMLTLVQSSMVSAAGFSDVPKNHWAKSTIEWGIKQGITQGDGNNRFRPNDTVNQAEFMALLVRAFPADYELYEGSKKWYEPYYALAKQLGWQYSDSEPANIAFNRGLAAQLIYNALEQRTATVKDAVNHLLSEALATGKTSNTYEGFKPSDSLTRAEALTFVYRVYNYVNDLRGGSITSRKPVKVEKPVDTSIASMTLAGISLESTVNTLESKLGKPDRILKTKYEFVWYVYNKDGKHLRYAVEQNKVIGFYSNSLDVFAGGKYRIGVNTKNGVKDHVVIEGDYRLEMYFDSHDPKQVLDSIIVLKSYNYYSISYDIDEEVHRDMELGIFDITNSYRYKHGLTTLLSWSEQANQSAYLHSKDMRQNGYFEHDSLDGRSPFDRMKEQGINYRSAGENIAWGYSDDIDVMDGWINSLGHRNNILNSRYTHLGVGVYANYYTQNFYSEL